MSVEKQDWLLRMIGMGALVCSAAFMLWLLLTAKVWAATLCAENPGDKADRWMWREIDGRKCWYIGQRVLPKTELRWGGDAPARERAKSEERTKGIERARIVESTISAERARSIESTTRGERASTSESTTRTERASRAESTKATERATTPESTKSGERATSAESTKILERATSIESTTISERTTGEAAAAASSSILLLTPRAAVYSDVAANWLSDGPVDLMAGESLTGAAGVGWWLITPLAPRLAVQAQR